MMVCAVARYNMSTPGPPRSPCRCLYGLSKHRCHVVGAVKRNAQWCGSRPVPNETNERNFATMLSCNANRNIFSKQTNPYSRTTQTEKERKEYVTNYFMTAFPHIPRPT